MHGTINNGSPSHGQQNGSSEATDHFSKKVMLRAERRDSISILDVITRFRRASTVPSEVMVVRRTSPYFGPKLILSDEQQEYMLTAPGPKSELYLWEPVTTDDGERKDWQKLAEVTATFADDQPQYDLCPECGQPMQTIEHERRAAVGRCPGPE
jgi:hypothetical protein